MTERLVIDALGTVCPVPVIELADAIETVPPGTTIEVLSDDAAAKVDIPVWCRMKGHEYGGHTERERGWSFLVTRRA